ncbi:MAG: glycosyltransferase family 2 protein [Panacagrimonas sp.]
MVDPRILFVHIPKTAGMSLYYALLNWAGTERSLRFSHGSDQEREAFRQLSAEQVRSYRLITGHFSAVLFGEKCGAEWNYISVVRDPVERFVSMYRYVTAWADHPEHRFVKGFSAREYFEWLSRHHPFSRNTQSKMLTGTENLAVARQRLARYRLLGSLARLPEFVAELEILTGSRLQFAVHNESKGSITPESLDPELRRDILAGNAVDQALYEWVTARGVLKGEASRPAVSPTRIVNDTIREPVAEIALPASLAAPVRIVFVHAPKTAGISLFNVLKDWAGADQAIRYPRAVPKHREALMALRGEKLDALRVVSGHFRYPVFRQACGDDWQYISVVRDPVDRIVSVYRYIKGWQEHPAHDEVRNLDFAGFFAWLNKNPHNQNTQVKLLTGQDDLEQAKRVAGQYRLIGSVSRMDLFERELGRLLGQPVHIGTHNQSKSSFSPEDISDALRAEIEAANAVDRAFFEWIQQMGVLVGGAQPVQNGSLAARYPDEPETSETETEMAGTDERALARIRSLFASVPDPRRKPAARRAAINKLLVEWLESQSRKGRFEEMRRLVKDLPAGWRPMDGAQRMIATVELWKGKTDQAHQRLRRVSNRLPDLGPVLLGRAHAAMAAGDAADAETALLKALDTGHMQDLVLDELSALRLMRRHEALAIELPSRPRLAIASSLKDEGDNVLEWLCYHASVGVEHFYLYLNDCTDQTLAQVRKFARQDAITLHQVEGEFGQLRAYRHFVDTYRHHARWVAFLDADEYLVPTEGDSVLPVIEQLESAGAAAIAVNWLIFGSNGHQQRPAGTCIESFTRRAPDPFRDHRFIKSIYRVSAIVRYLNPHHSRVMGRYLHANGKAVHPVNGRIALQASAPLCINHYHTKSRAQMIAKHARGRPLAADDSRRIRNMSFFTIRDRNDVEDLRIQRFVPATLALMQASIAGHAASPAQASVLAGTNER